MAKDTLVDVVIEGRGKVSVGQPMDVANFVRPYIDGYIKVRRTATGDIEKLPLNKALLKEYSYTIPKVGDTETIVRLSYIDSAYGSRLVDVVCDAYEHMVTFDLPQENGEGAIRFFNGDEFSIPPDIWNGILKGLAVDSDGSLDQLFLGWRSAEIPGELIVDKVLVPRDAGSISMQAQPVFDLDSNGYGHLRVEAMDGRQVLTAISDPSALGGGTLSIPEGVNGLRFDAGMQYPGIDRIELPSTICDVDVASVVKAFPDLSEWAVSADNATYGSTFNGYLTRKADPIDQGDASAAVDRVSLESVPPAINVSGGVDIDESVVSFGKDAFTSFGKDVPLYLSFESEDVLFEDWKSIPDRAFISAPVNSPSDRAYCRYLSAVALHRPSLHIIEPTSGLVRNGGSYKVGSDGVVRFHQDDGSVLLAYVPSIVSGSYEVPDDVSGIATTAFIDASSLITVVLHGGMDLFERHSLAGENLTGIVVPYPDTISFGSASAVFEPRSEYPTDFVVLLSCEKGSEGYGRWLDRLTLDWGDASQAEKALLCLGDAAGDVETDADTGSVYIRNGNDLVLCSVPSSVSRLDMKPDTTEVMGSAFAACSKLKIVQFPDTVRHVGDDAFTGCSSLEAVLYSDAALEGGSLDDWVSRVGLDSAGGCTSLQMVKPASSFTSDGETAVYERILGRAFSGRAFSGRASDMLELAFVVLDAKGALELLPNTVSVAPKAAINRKGLETISGFSSVNTVGIEAFSGCESLRSVAGFNSVSVLADRCFTDSGISGTLDLTGVNLSIGENAFAGCKHLREVNVYGSVSTLGTRTFEGCDYLQKVKLGDASTSIITTGTETFKGCSALSSLSISGALKRIGGATFANCTSLTSVSFLESCKTSLASIESDAFRNCVALNGFTISGLSALESVGQRFLYVDPATAASSYGRSSRANSTALLISRITLPASLKSIGDSAFGNQTALQTVEISGSDSRLSSVGESAFVGCDSLRQVDLGVSVAPLVVGRSAFEGCADLQRVTLPKTMTTLNDRAFKDCSALSSFVLRGSGSSAWTILGNEAFTGCSTLNSIDLSSTQIALIGSSAFANCSALTLVTLPSTLTALGERAFAGCSALVTISLLSETPPSVGAGTFAGCDVDALSVQVPQSQGDSVLSAYRNDPLWKDALTGSSGSFDGSNITSVDPEMVVFEGASYRRVDGGLALVKVDPTMVGSDFTPMSQASIIKADAFKGCSSLTALKIPASIKRIEAGAFKGCSGLEIVAFEADRPAAFGGSLFGDETPNAQFKLYVPAGSTNWYGSVSELEKYRIVTGGATFAVQDGGLLFTSYNSATTPSAFEVLFKVPRSFGGTISIGAETDYIADSAAEGCTSIREVYLNGYCFTIGRKAFKGCTSLTHVDLGKSNSNNLRGIGESAFEGCSSLKTLAPLTSSGVSSIPTTVTSFGPRVFKDCTSLPSLSLQGAVENVPDGFLEGCTRLGYLTAGSNAIESIRSFGDSCFKGCISMTTAGASLSSFTNLRSIGNNAYAGCKNLSLVTLPAALSEIGAGAFSGCTNIDVIAFNAGSPISIGGTGLDEVLADARVFVPLGTKSAWEQSFAQQPFILDDVSATYRAISGNIYAETRYVSGTEGDLSFLATTKNASSSGTVNAYDKNLLQTKSVNARALADQSHVKVFNAGAHCEMIGDRAFDGTGASSFTLNLSAGTVIPQIGFKIFGDSIYGDKDIKIVVQTSLAQDYIDSLSPRLRGDYGMELHANPESGSNTYLSLVPVAAVDDVSGLADSVVADDIVDVGIDSADIADMADADIDDKADPGIDDVDEVSSTENDEMTEKVNGVDDDIDDMEEGQP